MVAFAIKPQKHPHSKRQASYICYFSMWTFLFSLTSHSVLIFSYSSLFFFLSLSLSVFIQKLQSTTTTAAVMVVVFISRSLSLHIFCSLRFSLFLLCSCRLSSNHSNHNYLIAYTRKHIAVFFQFLSYKDTVRLVFFLFVHNDWDFFALAF